MSDDFEVHPIGTVSGLEAEIKRLEAKQEVILTSKQIAELAEFAGICLSEKQDEEILGDEAEDCEWTIKGLYGDQGLLDDDGETIMHYNHMVYCSEYWDEGAIGLGPLLRESKPKDSE